MCTHTSLFSYISGESFAFLLCFNHLSESQSLKQQGEVLANLRDSLAQGEGAAAALEDAATAASAPAAKQLTAQAAATETEYSEDFESEGILAFR